jgi:hypothetical protein
MDTARHVIKRMLNPHFFSHKAAHDVASTIHQSLINGDCFLPEQCKCFSGYSGVDCTFDLLLSRRDSILSGRD